MVLFSCPTLAVNRQSYSISQQEYTWLPPAGCLPAGAGSCVVDGVSPQPCRFPTPATLLTLASSLLLHFLTPSSQLNLILTFFLFLQNTQESHVALPFSGVWKSNCYFSFLWNECFERQKEYIYRDRGTLLGTM